jgi:hypothetical protein
MAERALPLKDHLSSDRITADLREGNITAMQACQNRKHRTGVHLPRFEYRANRSAPLKCTVATPQPHLGSVKQRKRHIKKEYKVDFEGGTWRLQSGWPEQPGAFNEDAPSPAEPISSWDRLAPRMRRHRATGPSGRKIRKSPCRDQSA